ncbi:hypothetical protein CTA2_9169 [Colletotrichum tanaceti]|uniref:Midasin n=1 Tax=Colletotrichum tanaceti TaxID=1306861 RepID=A0A4U6XI40_9PEZI|nr:hypothetical protein CTA2_9169 [Colletotrichum tanaceti]TKW55119.1 hypothetical protein CTA1_6963 [Colletotrichum tanaceti]
MYRNRPTLLLFGLFFLTSLASAGTIPHSAIGKKTLESRGEGGLEGLTGRCPPEDENCPQDFQEELTSDSPERRREPLINDDTGRRAYWGDLAPNRSRPDDSGDLENNSVDSDINDTRGDEEDRAVGTSSRVSNDLESDDEDEPWPEDSAIGLADRGGDDPELHDTSQSSRKDYWDDGFDWDEWRKLRDDDENRRSAANGGNPFPFDTDIAIPPLGIPEVGRRTSRGDDEGRRSRANGDGLDSRGQDAKLSRRAVWDDDSSLTEPLLDKSKLDESDQDDSDSDPRWSGANGGGSVAFNPGLDDSLTEPVLDKSRPDESELNESELDGSELDESELDESDLDDSDSDPRRSNRGYSVAFNPGLDDSLTEPLLDKSRPDESELDRLELDGSELDGSELDGSELDESELDESDGDESNLDESGWDPRDFRKGTPNYIYDDKDSDDGYRTPSPRGFDLPHSDDKYGGYESPSGRGSGWENYDADDGYESPSGRGSGWENFDADDGYESNPDESGWDPRDYRKGTPNYIYDDMDSDDGYKDPSPRGFDLPGDSPRFGDDSE